MERILLASPHMSKEGYELEYIHDAFDKNWIAPLGENVDKFEQEVAELVGIDHTAALDSGTSAIHLALKLAGVKQGDIVLCQTLTFVATVNPVLYEKAVPVFIDSEPGSWNLDPKLVENAIIKYKPKALIAVHLYGLAAKIDEIKEICERHGVVLIEDAAESLGTIYKNQWTGTFGDFGIYSFNGNKIITTSGGGMLASNNKEMIDKAVFYSTQAREQEIHYEHEEIGYNYRMSNIVAGIGRGQLNVLEERVQQKRHIFETYYNAFKDIPEIEIIREGDNERANYWLSTMIIHSDTITPKMVYDALNDHNIESRPVWKPMHLQPVFKDYDFVGTNVAEELFNKGLCLPSDTKMTDEDLQRVVDVVLSVFER
ncbi:DegT/DnrJ/EryC1/StrS family aminotransferase [Aerococcaceae bacterium DSM 111176]|nr:DegT/DnrJ/EryC1/StrS family aminotransferase [Aerococcaceae bacterium DSM 111176]